MRGENLFLHNAIYQSPLGLLDDRSNPLDILEGREETVDVHTGENAVLYVLVLTYRPEE